MITPVVAGIRDMVAGLRTLITGDANVGSHYWSHRSSRRAVVGCYWQDTNSTTKNQGRHRSVEWPIVAIGAVMVVAVVNFGKNIKALKTDWDYLLNHLRTTSAGIGDVLTGNLSGWWGKVRTTWGKNIDYLRDKVGAVLAYFTGKKERNRANAGRTGGGTAANEMTGSAGAMQEVAASAAIAASSVDNLTTSFKELGKGTGRPPRLRLHPMM